MNTSSLTITIAGPQDDVQRLGVAFMAMCIPPEKAEASFQEAQREKVALLPMKFLPARIGKPSVGAARNFLRALGVKVIHLNHKEQFVDLNVLEAAIRAHEVAVPAARGPVLRRAGEAVLSAP